MTGSRPVNEHDALLEAFRAGWQAGLGVTVKSPGALAVIEGCFEMWLKEAADEVELFGMVFRGRQDLPSPSRLPARPGERLPPPPPKRAPVVARIKNGGQIPRLLRGTGPRAGHRRPRHALNQKELSYGE